MRGTLSKIVSSRWVQHMVFWLLSLLFISWYFSIANEVTSVDFVYALFFHMCLIPLIYVNIEVLIPRFLKQKKYILFITMSAANVGIAYLIHEIVFEAVIPVLPIEYYIVSFTDIPLLLSIFLIYLIVTTLLYFSKAWFHLENIRSEAVTMELHHLRNQISPHFLLNALNTIYGLTLEKSDTAPTAILQLGDLLKHMLYQKEGPVKLKEEIDQIGNYVELQKIRLINNTQVQFEVKQEELRGKIIPFLLLTFVENAFKHGDLHSNPRGFIHIKVDQNDNFRFVVENSVSAERQKKGKQSGIGLANARRRLELTYGNNFELQIHAEENRHQVDLKVRL